MTSEERREIRYQRRKAKRDEARLSEVWPVEILMKSFRSGIYISLRKSAVKECTGKVLHKGISAILSQISLKPYYP